MHRRDITILNIIYYFLYVPILLNIKHIKEHICAIITLSIIFAFKALLPTTIIITRIINCGLVLFSILLFLLASYALFAVTYNTIRKSYYKRRINRKKAMIGSGKIMILRHGYRFFAMSLILIGIFYYKN